MEIRATLRDLARRATAKMPKGAREILERFQPPVVKPEPSAPAPAPMPEPAKPKPINWELRSQAEIVDHIEQHYHARLRSSLPALIASVRSVDGAPRELADLLQELASELEAHMLKEERVLFPTLRTGTRGGPIDMPIRMLERDHEAHDEQLERIRSMTNQYTAESDELAALYSKLSALDAELREHIYLENNVLFARALGGEY